MNHLIRNLTLALPIAAVAGSVCAETLRFPGPAPCDSTLQACIDGADPGDTVLVDSNGPFPGLSIAKSLHLRAAFDRLPTLVPDAAIEATLPDGGPNVLSIEGFRLIKGRITVNDQHTSDTVISIRRNRLLFQDGGVPATPYIQLLGGDNGTITDVDISENVIETASGASEVDSIRVVPQKRLTGRIAFNRIESSGHRQSGAIRVHGRRGRDDNSVAIYGNYVSGRFEDGAIIAEFSDAVAADGAISRADIYSNAVRCVAGVPGFGRGLLVRNLDTGPNGVFHAFNNTIIECDAPLLATAPSGASIAGGLVNNLIAFNAVSIQTGDGAVGQFTIDSNLSHGNTVNTLPAGASNTITAAPSLYSRSAPRLRAGSPAINAGNGSWALVRLDEAGRPRLDADGGRRFIGDTGIDVGAYEYGDFSIYAEKADDDGNHTMFIDDAATNGNTALRLQATATTRGGVSNQYAFGVWYSGGQWSVFNQGFDTMPMGAAYNVLAPGAEGAGSAVYAHIALPSALNPWETALSHPYLDTHNDDEAVVLVTANWNQPGSGVYNDNQIAVGACTTQPAGAGCWTVFNQSLANMPDNASINLYAQDRSPTAFVHHVTTDNVLFSITTVIDHPLLNDNPCVGIHVTSRLVNGGMISERAITLHYFAGRWRIVSSGGLMTLADSWYVVFSGRQAYECLNDRLFADGFESQP